MFWITCSSQSTKRVRKPCAKDSVSIAVAIFCLTLTSTTVFAAKAVSLEPRLNTAFAPTGVFQSIELETNATSGLANWNRAKRKFVTESASYKACDSGAANCPLQLRNWRAKLAQWSDLTPRAKLIQVNRFANAAIAYTDDRKAFRSADYWATPLESLNGRGDCEDYVLLKYASLRSLGFAEDQLRIVIVKDLKAGIGHAVLSVKVKNENYILDNQDNRVLRHDSITRYAPLYSVNTKGRWINIATRDLKRRKAAPVVLLASSTELGELAVALPRAKAMRTAKPKANLPAKVRTVASLVGPIQNQRMSATATIALLQIPSTVSVTLAQAPFLTWTQRLFASLQPLASLLRPTLWG